MPPRGRPPKSPSQLLTRARTTGTWVEVQDVPYAGKIPRLPALIPGLEVPWPAQTRATWRVWSRMAHCVLWSPADWSYALDTLVVAAQFHLGNGLKYATELRNREKVLGTTFDARQGLRIRYVEPEVKPRAKGESNISYIDTYAKL